MIRFPSGTRCSERGNCCCPRAITQRVAARRCSARRPAGPSALPQSSAGGRTCHAQRQQRSPPWSGSPNAATRDLHRIRHDFADRPWSDVVGRRTYPVLIAQTPRLPGHTIADSITCQRCICTVLVLRSSSKRTDLKVIRIRPCLPELPALRISTSDFKTAAVSAGAPGAGSSQARGASASARRSHFRCAWER